MTDFPNPYEREFVPKHEFVVPGGVKLEKHKPIKQFSVLVENGEQHERSFQVLLFTEGDEVPEDIAQWLNFRSQTDELIMTETADDRYRFGDIGEIQRRFLKDQGGRRLYCLVDEESQALSGALWLHPLEGGETGTALVRACEVFNNYTEHSSDRINPAKMATLASRMYTDIRHHKAHTPFLLASLGEYYDQWPDCEGVVIRISEGNHDAVLAFTSERVAHIAPFMHLHKEDHVYYLANRGFVEFQANNNQLLSD